MASTSPQSSAQTNPTTTSSSPADFYQKRIDSLDSTLSALAAKDRQLSWGRLVAFLIFLGLALAGFNGLGNWLFVLAALFFAGFVFVVGYHERTNEDINANTMDRTLAQWQIGRIERRWEELGKTPGPAQTLSDSAKGMQAAPNELSLDEFVVNDLDIYGPASLWHLINRTFTPLGEQTLNSWIRNPGTNDELRNRQAAVKALAQQPEQCHEFAVKGALLNSRRGSSSLEFLEWSENGGWLRHRAGLMWLLRALGCVCIAVLVGVLAQWLAISWALVLLALLGTSVIINVIWIGKVHDTFNQISAGKYDLQYYQALFQRVANLPEQPARLGELKAKMRAGEVQFEDALGRFWRILKYANGRKSGVLAIFWLFAQLIFFWDFHVLWWLEKWQRKFGTHVRVWFEAVAELEALGSLATLSHDHPSWTFAELADNNEAAQFQAEQLGHPLIPPENCVQNDCTFGPSGTFLLVTGSNMSGKSTLLRSIGLNTILGLAGGPVFANAFSLPRVVLVTSMRITDSLNSGVSFFMAELKRVKSIVDRAKHLDESKQPRLLYLLDEILQGTNSAERHIAVARILQHLLATSAIGAISTHDLELADSEQLKDTCKTVHLRETIEKTPDGDKMRFDYIVRPGVTPTTNALRLLDLVGLRSPGDEGKL